MRARIIEAIKKTGELPPDLAEKVYELFRDKAYGYDPSESQVAQLTEADLAGLPAGNRRTLWTAILSLRPTTAGPAKPAALKEKHAETADTSALLASYLTDGPRWVADALRRRATPPGAGGDVPCLFLDDAGKVMETESVQWIDWIRRGVPLGEYMNIGGKDRRPVRIGAEKPEVKHLRDPFAVGLRPLTMPGLMSECLASFEPIPENDRADAVRFLILVKTTENPSPIEQRRAIETAAKGLPALHEAYPKAKRAWDNGGRPYPYVTPGDGVPFGEPVAPTTAPRIGRDVEPTVLAPSDNEIIDAVISAGLERRALLAGLPVGFTASLHTAGSPAAQHRQDYYEIKRVGRLRNGPEALSVYLTNAEREAAGRVEADVFRRAIVSREPKRGAPVLCIVTGREPKAQREAEKMKQYLAPAVEAGALRVTDDYDIGGGVFVTDEVARRIGEATHIVAIVCMDTLASKDFCKTIAAGKPLMPVVTDGIGTWKWNPTLRGLSVIDGSNMAVAAQNILDTIGQP